MTDTVNLELYKKVYKAARRLAQLLLPSCCLLCGDTGQSGLELCQQCQTLLPWQGLACQGCAVPLPGPGPAKCGACLRHPAPLDTAHAVFTYAWPVDRLLLGFKFHQDLSAGRLLARLMTEHCATLPQPQALVAVTLHPHRLRQRGYDQTLELARPLARSLRLPCLTVLQRLRDTSAQSELAAAQRRRNLRNAFAVTGAVPEHVAVVDDVMTTGATLHAAAHALRRAGARQVDAWVCARVP